MHFSYQVELTNASSKYCLWLCDEEIWSYRAMISNLQIYHPQICYYREKTIAIPAAELTYKKNLEEPNNTILF